MLAELIFPIPLRQSFHYLLPEDLELTAAPCLRAEVSLGRKETVGLIVKVAAEKDINLQGIKLKRVKKILDEEPLFEEPILELAAKMSEKWGAPFGQCAWEFYQNIQNKNLKRFKGKVVLDISNNAALGDICFPKEFISGIKQDKSNTFLLRIPTALQQNFCINISALLQGGQALFLVPDQNYAEQLYGEMYKVFKDKVALWHAQISNKEAIVEKVSKGEIIYLIGTKTAVFLPFAKLRFGFINSNQEEVYRNTETSPLYNAAEVLNWRLSKTGGKTIIYAQYPSVENYGRAKAGKMQYYEISSLSKPEHYENTAETIEICNMEAEIFGSILSSKVSEKICELSENGKKIAVIAPRKGFASRLFCTSCGKMLRCPKCGPGLGLVKKTDASSILQCRKCGKTFPVPNSCPACGGTEFREFGIGTQKIESLLKKLIPNQKILRYDGDILRGSIKKRQEILNSFIYGDTQVLTCTKIALQSLKPESLSLIVLIDADADLSSPDFRASEKLLRTVFYASSLLKPNGKIYLQTREADNFIFSALSYSSYEKFCQEELEIRKFFHYPPYSRLLNVRFASKNINAVKACGIKLKNRIQNILSAKKAELIGPVIPRGQENRKFTSEYWTIKAFSPLASNEILKRVISMPQPQDVKFFIMPDPYDFL